MLVVSPRVVTCDARLATHANPLGAIDDGAVSVRDGRIHAVGRASELRERFADESVVRAPGVLTPGLVDAHTHAPWVGSRAGEYALRLAGAGYEAIAAAGGGIVASMRSVRGG